MLPGFYLGGNGSGPMSFLVHVRPGKALDVREFGKAGMGVFPSLWNLENSMEVHKSFINPLRFLVQERVRHGCKREDGRRCFLADKVRFGSRVQVSRWLAKSRYRLRQMRIDFGSYLSIALFFSRISA
jgi:hypothetical protein